jgi:O-methyltransferase
MSLLSDWFPALKQSSVESRRAKKFHQALFDLDEEAQQTIIRVKDQTMMDPEKLYAFIAAVRYVCKHDIRGDIVECGVWRGGAIMAAALTLNQLGSTGRRFYLYDTFAGMPRPGQRDRPLAEKLDTLAYFEGRRTGDDSSDWCCASVDVVRQNLATVAYDQDKFVLIEGKVEDTLPRTLPGPIAILHLDTDWYESTRHQVEHLMPLMVPGGVLIVDDYFYWSGNRDAVDEYLDRHKIPVLLTKVRRSVIGVVP